MNLNATTVERDYNMSDDDMEALAHLFLGHGRAQQPDLARKDPDLTPAWFDALETEIEQTEDLETIDGRRGESKARTDGKKLSMKEGRAMLQDLFFYVRKAFKSSEATQQLFGTDLYERAAYHAGHLRDLLAQAHGYATDAVLKPQLATAGFADFARLGELAGVVTAATTEAGMERSSNKVSTEVFINRHNALWAQLVVVSEAAKRAFLDDPALRRLFLLYPPDGRSAAETPAPPPAPLSA